MWSFGCIMAELITGKPMFPAHDERHLLEYIVLTVGNPPEHMLKNSTKRARFYNQHNELIRSPRSKISKNSKPGQEPIRVVLKAERDDEFIDFIEVSESLQFLR